MEKFESPQGEPQQEGQGFIERNLRRFAAAAAIVGAAGAFQASQESADVPTDGTVATQQENDPGTYMAPRESIPDAAFAAAAEYNAKYEGAELYPSDPEKAVERTRDFDAIAEKHGVTSVDMLQALRNDMEDARLEATKDVLRSMEHES